jgi:hypothetical protein
MQISSTSFSSTSFSLNAEFLHARTQGAGTKAEHDCGPFRSFDSPMCLIEDLKDMSSLAVLQGIAGGMRGRVRRAVLSEAFDLTVRMP